MIKKCAAILLSSVMIMLCGAEAFAYISPDYNMTGWIITENNSSYTLDFDDKNSGEVSLKSVISSGGNIKIKADMSGVDASTEYEFSFYIKASNPDSCKVVRDILYSTALTPSNAWGKETVSFTSRSTGTLSIQFEFKNTTDTDSVVWLDECSLVKSGEDKNLLINGGFDDGVDMTAPEPVTDVACETGDKSCLVKWTDSKSSDAEKVRLYKNGECVAEIERGTGEYLIENLENGTVYTYSLVAADSWNNESEAVEFTFVPNVQREAPEVSADDENNVITGIDESMEYQLDGGEWITYSQASAPDLSGCHIVYVRYKADGDLREGKKAILIFYDEEERITGDFGAEIEIDINGVTLSGVSADSLVTAAVSPSESDFYTDIVFARELEVTDGEFECTFIMPDFSERGKYTAVVSTENVEEPVLIEFSYVPGNDVESFAKSLTELDESGVISAITNKDNCDILETVGINTNDFYNISDYSKLAAELKSESKPTAETFAVSCGIHTAFDLLAKAEKSADVIQVLNKYNKSYIGLSFEDISWDEVNDNELKEWIGKQLMQEFSSKDETDEAYMFANIYYLVNKSSYDSLEKVMKKYASEMELEGSGVYDDFLDLDSAKRKKALKEVKLASDEYTNNDNFIDELEKGVEEASKKTGGSSSGGGGGGGSSSGKTGFASTVSNPVQITTDKKTETGKPETVVFKDVDDSHWAKDAIIALYNKKILSGMGDGTFNPDGAVTREQLAKMISDSFDFELSAEVTSFTDVNESRWSYPYIVLMKSVGVINGYEDGSFKPSDEITREDMAVMLCRACDIAGVSLDDKRDFAEFTDIGDVSGYAIDSLERLYKSEILSGVGEEQLSPKGTATRAMAAKLIYSITGGIR